MNKFLKAEFYRSIRSGLFFPILVFFGLFPWVTTALNASLMEEKDLFSILFLHSQGGGIVFWYLVISLMLGNAYQDRTYYYEIIDGANTHKIILSRLVVYNTFTTAILIIPAIIVFSIIGATTGLGDMESPWVAAILGSVIILNLNNLTVLITMIIRRMLGGAVLLLTLNMFSVTIYELLSYEENSKVQEFVAKLLGYLPQIQIFTFVQPEYSVKYICEVIGSFIVMLVLFYSLTYISYKKKNFR